MLSASSGTPLYRPHDAFRPHMARGRTRGRARGPRHESQACCDGAGAPR
jgi:hypothetical protein